MKTLTWVVLLCAVVMGASSPRTEVRTDGRSVVTRRNEVRPIVTRRNFGRTDVRADGRSDGTRRNEHELALHTLKGQTGAWARTDVQTGQTCCRRADPEPDGIADGRTFGRAGGQTVHTETRTVQLRLENTARCDTDVRLTQDGRAVVSRAVVPQLSTKRIFVEVEDGAGSLRLIVRGRQCRISYQLDVPLGAKTLWAIEVADTPQLVVVRN